MRDRVQQRTTGATPLSLVLSAGFRRGQQEKLLGLPLNPDEGEFYEVGRLFATEVGRGPKRGNAPRDALGAYAEERSGWK